MCGVSFYLSRSSNYDCELSRSLDLMAHRGPDARGQFVDCYSLVNIGMGHTRLSIMDTSDDGSQPMFKDDLVITFNGEIYNHEELREILISEFDVSFNSGSDTEVILNLFQRFREKSFSMLRGMYAIVIYDKSIGKIYVARDTIGIKPLYFYKNSDSIFFASEIKALRSYPEVKFDISKDDVYEFFNNGFLYEPNTGYSYIKKAVPGILYIINLDDLSVTEKDYKDDLVYDVDASLDSLVSEALRRQDIADVPLGIFFSGGLDSSIIASVSTRKKLLFAKYESDYYADIDLRFSKKIARHLKKDIDVCYLGAESITPESILDKIDFVAKNTEELISDFTFYSTYQLSKAASDSGFKVMLSGMGGDEVFGGYPRYNVVKYDSLIRAISPLLKFAHRFNLYPKRYDKRFERLVSYSSEKFWPLAYSRLLGYFSDKDLKSMFKDDRELRRRYTSRLSTVVPLECKTIKSKVKLAQLYDFQGFLSHNLMVSDKASMLASIELRVPLLDEALVHKGERLCASDMIKNKKLKYPLYGLAEKLLPKKLLDRPKTGFNPPLDNMIYELGENNIKIIVSNLSDFINLDHVNYLIDQHFSGRTNNTYKIWQLLYFSRWLNFGV